MVMTMVTMALIYFYHVPGTDAESHHINPVRLMFSMKIFFPL